MRPRLLQFGRLLLFSTALWLIHRGTPVRETAAAPAPALHTVRLWFPECSSLGNPRMPRGHWPVLADSGTVLGHVLRTAPQTDALTGYAGPNDILVAETPDGTVLGISVLNSGDTPDHVRLVKDDPDFSRSLSGWNPSTAPPPAVQAVSGATLTSMAMTEGVIRRLTGNPPPSLRFPEEIRMEEVLNAFPGTAEFDGRTALDAEHRVLGHLLRTSPASDNVAGYAGPTESLIALDPDGTTVRSVILRKSYDTPDYVDQVRDDPFYLGSFKGRTLSRLAGMDFAAEGIEGVSGATLTSYAVAEGLKRRAALELTSAETQDHAARPVAPLWKTRDLLLALIVAGSLVMAFTPLRGRPAVRFFWQALLIGYLGLTAADLLSLGLLTGWARHGPAWRSAPGLVLLAAAALLVPWAGGRQLYCHHLCPHGAAQILLGKLSPWKLAVPARTGRLMEKVPGTLLILAFFAALGWIPLNNASLEPFDAWSWRAAGTASLVLAAAGLLAALFIPQAYCRYGCPTGALLKWLRTRGPSDRLNSRDTLALLAVLAALLLSFLPGPPAVGPPAPRTAVSSVAISSGKPVSLTGATMGTTWSLRLRETPELSLTDLQASLQSRLDRIENLLSTWNEDTPVSRFNRAATTAPIPLPAEVISLLRFSRSVSVATSGACDATVGRLVQAWGFGPPPRPPHPPNESEIRSLRECTGYQKLQLFSDTAAKSNPGLAIDLTFLAEGYALDDLAHFLAGLGFREFLLEIGGELRAAGTWPIAVDFPFQPLTLANHSLSTSGTYRQQTLTSAGPATHLIDPRTGRPVRHHTRSVSVLAADSATADSWATALNVLGEEDGLPLATRLGIAARFVTEPAHGQLRITSTPGWREQNPAPLKKELSKAQK